MPCIQRDYCPSPHHTLSSLCTLIVLLVTTHVHGAVHRRWALSWSHHDTFPQNPWATRCYSQGGRTEQAVLLSCPHFRAEHPTHLPQLHSQLFLGSPALECTPGWDAPEGSRDYWSIAHACQPASAHPVLLSLCESQ